MSTNNSEIASRQKIQEIFRSCLSKASQSGQFEESAFFGHWFRDNGQAYYFLFKKSLRVTNLQYNELVAQIRSHIKHDLPDGNLPSQFTSAEEFREATTQVIGSVQIDNVEPLKKIDMIAELYTEILSNYVAIHALFGSCIVYLPPCTSINLDAVLSMSGYVHSAGRLVFVRNTQKVEPNAAIQAVRDHIKRHPGSEGRKVPFVVYSHEDFTNFDRIFSSDLRYGLDDTKLYTSKYFVGSDPLPIFLRSLSESLSDAIYLVPPGPYKDTNRRVRSQADIDRSRTLWLVCDKDITETPRAAGEKTYYVCYDQTVKNGNPFHTFDEDKPAWHDHVTIPHTLAGALLNIALAGTRDLSHVEIADPFFGTGTVLLEAAKFKDLSISGCDDDPLCELVLADNHKFFGLPPGELKKIISACNSLYESSLNFNPVGTKKRSGVEDPTTLYREVTEFLTRCEFEDIEAEIRINSERVAEAKDWSLLKRLIFYVCLRALRRHRHEFQHESIEWDPALKHELAGLLFRMNEWLDQLEEMQHSVCRDDLQYFPSSYSTAAFVDTRQFTADDSSSLFSLDRIMNVQREDFREFLVRKKGALDAIITDPPYGFNTSEGMREAAALFHDFYPLCINALKPRGRLVFCLPNVSFTGRHIPYFAKAHFAIQEILLSAAQAGRRVVQPGASLPWPNWIFRGELYWESEKALRRRILLFEIE